MLVNRDYAISSFKKEKYHVVRLNAGGVSALSERLNDEAAAQQMKAACEKSQAVCTYLKKEKKTVSPRWKPQKHRRFQPLTFHLPPHVLRLICLLYTSRCV